MKYLLFCWAVIALMASAMAVDTDEPDAKAILARALRETPKSACYQTVVEFPDQFCRTYTQGIYTRYVDPDGNRFLRLELYEGKKLVEIHVGTPDGFFGWTPDGSIALRFIVATKLLLLENMSNPFYSIGMENSEYKIADSAYCGIPCYKITVSVMPWRYDLRTLAHYTGTIQQADASRKNDFFRCCPMVRVFLIGKEDNIVYSREHYGDEGEKLYFRKLGKPVKNPVYSETLFQLPEKINGTVMSDDNFLLQRLYEQRYVTKVRKSPSSVAKVWRWLNDHPIALGGVSGMILLAAWILAKFRRNRMFSGSR